MTAAMRTVWRRCLRAIRPDHAADVADELRFHVDELTRDLVAHGWDEPAARVEAERRFGEAAAVADECRTIDRRQRRRLALVEPVTTLMRNVRFGARMLRRTPGFTLVAVLCLTLGIASNAAVYSWIEGILLRPYPLVTGQDRMMAVAGTNRGEPGNTGLSWPDFIDLRANARLFDAFVVGKITGTTLSVGDRAERVPGQIVSANYFDAIGVRPILGRGFAPDEEIGANAHPVTVISWRLWQNRFKGDAQIVGRTQLMNGIRHTIVGVAPEGFNGTFVGYAMQFWVPVSMEPTFDFGAFKLDDRSGRWVESFARLKPGVSAAQGEAELQSIAARLESGYPQTNRGRGIRLYPLWRTPFNAAGDLFPVLRIALVVAGLVLLISCANVSNLLLVRSLVRRQEFNVRLAIGAGRAQLIGQLLTEGLLLASGSGVAALLVAYWSRNIITRIVPMRGSAVNLPAALDWRVIALCGGVCVVTTLLFALVPALHTVKVDLAGVMRGDGGGVVGGSGRSRVRSALVVVQVSLSFVLLVATGLLVKSLQGMRAASPGFSTDALLSVVDLNSAGYDRARQSLFRDGLLAQASALPGVQSAAFARIPPFSFASFSQAPLSTDGYVPAPDEQPTVSYVEISPGYFATLAIPLVAGRDFARTDDSTAPPVAIVNEAMAERYWPGANALGRYLDLKGQRLQVVGIARTAHYRNLLETAQPFCYVPLRQHPAGLTVLFMRATTSRAAITHALAGLVRTIDPGLASAGVISLREQVDRQSGPQTLALSLVTGFGVLALLLAAIGLYGVMSYAVSQGTRELGLRMALGAQAADLLRLVLSSGLTLTAVGLVLGGGAALLTTRLMGTLLYRVSPLDPLAFGAALSVLLIAGVLACLLPAWRAARTDPVRALRL